MVRDVGIPRQQSAFLERSGYPTSEWYNWLRKLEDLFTTGDTGLQAQITQIAYILGSPDGTVANIPPFNTDFLPTDTIVRGEVSLTYSGTLASGQVVLMLVNDSANPGNSYYYGTDALGVKGWHSRALATLSDVDPTTPFAAGDAPVFDGTLFQPTAVLANPMTTLGDVITGDVGGVPKRLPVGADGTFLSVVAGEPAYVTAPGGSTANTVTALATSGSVGIDLALGDYFTIGLTGNVTGLTFTNLPGAGKGASKMVRITQDTTPRTFAWPASFKWAGGTPGAISTGSGAVDVLALTTFDNGTTWDVTLVKAFA